MSIRGNALLLGTAVLALSAMPVRAQVPDELRRLLPPAVQEEMRRDEHERAEERERREEHERAEERERRERQGEVRRDDVRERQEEIRASMFRLREDCERNDRRACVRFGVIIGQNQDHEAEWRRERPEYFWWDR
jgi:hypothetical protein